MNKSLPISLFQREDPFSKGGAISFHLLKGGLRGILFNLARDKNAFLKGKTNKYC
jgi:hypothetical protein